ncbi:MAG TPA: hypothetical protein PKU97_08660, partial [Kofleriaceae bacterium]|nr:hypothetical protein [Kofleriaceae bacterium]
LLDQRLGPADQAEIHRLRGLAAFFGQRLPLAESELLAYLRLDADAHLDPATVPPEAVTYFESVQAKHRAELRTLRAQRARTRKSLWVALVPVAGQLQNGERGKAWLVGASLTALVAINLASYVTLRRWCDEASGTCDGGGTDHSDAAPKVMAVNWASGAGLLVVSGLAMYDGVSGYRRSPTLAPNVGAGTVGVLFSGQF